MILLAQLARASHRASEVALNEVHILLHSSTAIPDGPAAPWVLSAAALMVSLVMLVNSTELWNRLGFSLYNVVTVQWCSLWVLLFQYVSDDLPIQLVIQGMQTS